MLNKLRTMFDFSAKEFEKAKKLAIQVDELEEEIQKLSDEELILKTSFFKQEIADGKTLDDILVEAFAVAREASFRVSGMKPYFVQLIGGIILHLGNIAEMKTGEGKTLTAVMPAYLNALSGNGVHIITVNEYLASREVEGEIGEIFRFLGLTVGLNLRDHNADTKREVYECDIVYTTNSEVGFDYLRDNMVLTKERRVQTRGLNYAIIDEVDSVLIDEARTPLIISGGKTKSDDLYIKANHFAKVAKMDIDFEVDLKSKSVALTSDGIAKAEKHFGIDNLYDLEHSVLVHKIQQAMRANYTLENEVDYVVHEGEIVIVDQFTGRMMPGRAFSDGLHQAIEAKENVAIKEETKTVATITYQNLFRMYKKLSGMTGTAKTEEEEFREIYNMYVISIPTNKEIIREDFVDKIYPTNEAKYKALVKEVKEAYDLGQPVLVGTVAVETSEEISKLFSKKGIKHEVLNAKNHFREAEIVAGAGQKHAVTIATNMAGRGTDIKLGEGVVELGGLYVIGTERHESRRIDNQLRGRSGRQGDIGKTQFFVSSEDRLIKRMGADAAIRKLTSSEEGMQSKILSRNFESTQMRVEGNNYDMRKRLLEFDDVMGTQRKIMYQIRNEILDADDYHDQLVKMMKDGITAVLGQMLNKHESFNDEAKEDVIKYVNSHYFHNELEITIDANNETEFLDEICDFVIKQYDAKMEMIENEEERRRFEKIIALRVIDSRWMDHIDAMAHLKEGVGMRGYAQENPLRAYSMEGRAMFDEMMFNIDKDIVVFALRSKIRVNAPEPTQMKTVAVTDKTKENAKKKPVRSVKIKPNEPCPCGSGKKYKHCCGKN